MLQYLIKFSISLAVLYIFYRAVLRPLTFYQCNRFYLLCYSLLSFVIPFINIAPWLGTGDKQKFVNFIPVIHTYNTVTELPAAPTLSWWQRLTPTDWLLAVFCLGVIVMLLKLMRQIISLRKIRLTATLLQTGTGVQLYETNASVSPFSFGNAIYFNRQLHTEEELQRIIQHEFVHVQQKHTIDLLTAELLCVVNWFNPFAWLIRYSIRQNLEFIADNNVVRNGIDKKEYQYLLLKVTGVPQYSIAGNFNLSNLKKRIAMMNKMKSTRLHLAKFLFILPLLAVVLLAFRNGKHHIAVTGDRLVQIAGMVVDVKTMEPIAGASVFCEEKNVTAVTDDKGYYYLQLPYENRPLQFTLKIGKDGYGSYKATENWGNFYHTQVREHYSNSVELFGIGKGLKEGNGFSALVGNTKQKEDLNYDLVLTKVNEFKKGVSGNMSWGDTVPAPPPPPPPAKIETSVHVRTNATPNNKGYIVTVADNSGECIVLVKDKNKNIVKAITLTDWNKNQAANEATYGKIPPPPPPPLPGKAAVPTKPGLPVEGLEAEEALAVPERDDIAAAEPVEPLARVVPDNVSVIVTKSNTDKSGSKTVEATVSLKNGKKEVYNLLDPKEKADFEKKYGGLTEGPPAKPAVPAKAAKPVTLHIDGLSPDAQPLFVVDGVEKANIIGVNSIAANTIKSVNVLKGNMATVKYGNKGVNGVVEINTMVPVVIVDSAIVTTSIHSSFKPVKVHTSYKE